MIKEYTKAIQSLPDFGKAYSYRAEAYLRVKKYAAALQDCNKAIAMNYNDGITNYRKAVACFELGEFETSRKCVQVATQLLLNNESSSNHEKLILFERLLRKCNLELEGKQIVF